MKYSLMHKNIRVAEMELDDVSGIVRKVGTVWAPEHLPVGISMVGSRADRGSLNEWWTDRSIPASRSGLREALETMEVASAKLLLMRCLGLSLSDQYWTMPAGAELTWEQLNFFDHPFSDDIGDILFGERRKADPLNFSSPDCTSDGNLKKRWKIIDGKRCLVKGGSSPFRQQPFNEMIASAVMDRLDIPHVPYTIIWNKGAPYSVCEDFITRETELIPAWRIIKTQKKKNDISLYRHFVHCAQTLGIPDVLPFLDRMIVLDYIIANEDRHLNNFGAVRNAETLKWIGMAPVYDSGSCLGYDKVEAEIRRADQITCKPFKNHHEEQLKLVNDFSWIHFEKLSDVKTLITDVLSSDGARDYMDPNRVKAIAETTQARIRHVQELSSEKRCTSEDSVKDDVLKNIAADYRGQAP